MKSDRHGTRISVSWTPASRAAARCFTSLFTISNPFLWDSHAFTLRITVRVSYAAVKELTVEPEVSLVATSTRH